jgi:hypothetical protein
VQIGPRGGEAESTYLERLDRQAAHLGNVVRLAKSSQPAQIRVIERTRLLNRRELNGYCAALSLSLPAVAPVLAKASPRPASAPVWAAASAPGFSRRGTVRTPGLAYGIASA